MKQNKKGFTLIELLAVIVILAIIALIATPIILNMISNARKSAAKSSALGYIDSINSFIPLAASAADLEITDDDYDTVTVPTMKCTKTDGTWSDGANTSTTVCSTFYGKVDNKTKGGKPTDATITIVNDQVDMTAADFSITIDGYRCIKDTKNSNSVSCTKAS